MKVLIAEDDPVSLTILQRSIEKLGQECLTAEDGEHAWQIYQQTPGIDVVISDWMMPDMDGPELCRRIREEEDNGYTYFIFLTALADKEHLLKGLEAGADDYLSKPLDRKELQVRLISASRVTSLHRRLADQNKELEQLNRRLFEQSREDPLTGLANRLRLREDLETLSARTERYGNGYCVILCDIDRFKLYNDTHGHQAGDDMLKAVAQVLRNTVRRGDTVYRYGGEELLAILPEQPPDTAALAAERIRRGVEEIRISTREEAQPEGVTISLGIASLLPGQDKTAEDVLKEADKALYRAKRVGRNSLAVYGREDEQ